jgi:hypothetical protein
MLVCFLVSMRCVLHRVALIVYCCCYFPTLEKNIHVMEYLRKKYSIHMKGT